MLFRSGAFNDSNVKQVVLSATGSGAVGVGGGIVTNVYHATTTAKINSYANINQGSRESESKKNASVKVVASSSTETDAGAGGVGIAGVVGVGAAVITIVQDKTTDAIIDEYAAVYAGADLVVLAIAQNMQVNVAIAVGGGIVGVSGSLVVLVLKDRTDASINKGAKLEAMKDVVIAADVIQKIGRAHV